MRSRRLSGVVTAAIALLFLSVLGGAGPAVAADPVSIMTAPVYQRTNPTTGANLVTVWADESKLAGTNYGFTGDLGSPFKASAATATGLGEVHRLYRAANADFSWALAGSAQLQRSVAAGYVDQGVNFYALAAPVSGQTVPVMSYTKGGMHRLALSEAGTALVGQGWSLEDVSFHVPGSAGAPPPPPPPPPPTGAVGSAPVGTTAYPVPAGAVHVAPWGSDAAAGSSGAPVRTVTRALALAPSGGTVVIRGGSYNESVVVQGKPVTIQAYPNEAVWLDGSVVVSGWVADGTAWRRDGWWVRFDHSPTYTQGAPDSTVPYWQFVNTATYPMASYPDQVFVDGAALRQVKSRSLVGAGAFFLDEPTGKLYIGSDPSGRTVSASTTIKALSIRQADVTVRGIGIRRFSPSVFHMGAVTVEAPRVTFENVVIEDSATTGISVLREDCRLRNVTIQRSGMLGIHGRYADRLALLGVRAASNNTERFNIAPVSGGAKLGQSRGIVVRDSEFSQNQGPGFWEDMSVYNTVITGSSFTDNAGDGIFLEISAKVIVANNFIARNGFDGMKVNNTSNVQIWNNTLVANAGRALWLAQDDRRNKNRSDPAVDPRVPWPDPEMPWTLGPVVLRNNVIVQQTTSGNSVMDVSDYSKQNTAEQMGISANGNLWQRSASNSPNWLVIWSRGAVSPQVFTSLATWRSTTGQEARGREFVGGTPLADAKGVAGATVTSLESSVALPLPADVAAASGQPVGAVHLGRW